MPESKKKKPVKRKKKKAKSDEIGHVSAVDIQHALRASLLLDTEDSRGQSTYSSLEVGIQIHVEGIPEGVDYKEVVAKYSEDVMEQVAQRVNLDARSLGFRAFTDYDDSDAIDDLEAEEVSDSEL